MPGKERRVGIADLQRHFTFYTMKKIKKRDLILILVIAVLAVCLMIYGLSTRKATVSPSGAIAAAETPALENNTEAAELQTETSPDVNETELTEGESAEKSEAAIKAGEYLATYPAESYLVVTTSNGSYNAIPLIEEGSFKISFSDDEYNIIHVGKNSAYMESSSCDNQNCVGEGEVTLENRDTRVLYNMILCLPHDLSLELIDADEALEYMTELYEMQAAYEEALAQYRATQETETGEGTENAG